jgi:hypothetical protein
MRKLGTIGALALIMSALAIAPPAQASVGVLEVTSVIPPPGTIFVEGAPTIPWSMTATPGFEALYVEMSRNPTIGGDGRSLAEPGSGSMQLRRAGTSGVYQSASGIPRRLAPGTYYWQARAGRSSPDGEYEVLVSAVYSFTLARHTGPPLPPDQQDGLEGTETFDRGLYTAFCPSRRAGGASRARAAGTSEAGWPAKECLKMDKGPGGRRHTLVGLNGVHNWLLGGYGNDTIIGGNHGDVIWGDYHPDRAPRSQTVTIHAGNGRNVIYANDTHNYVWTGTNPDTVVHAHVSGISGVIHCQSPHILLYLSVVSEHYFKLDGCRRISHYSVGF